MQRYPTVAHVNLLYLLSMLLILTLGALMQNASIALGLLGTEFLLILLPALLYLRLAGLPARETLRLRWPGARVAVLCLLAGLGVWLLDVLLEILSAALFGYAPPTPPDMFPANLAQSALLFLGLAVAAPLCEEVLFRGVMQRGYERFGARTAIVVSALLFAFYHVRLEGLPALLPIAFTLGYVVWRSNSLAAGMLAHFANNAAAALYLIAAGQRPDLPLGAVLVVAGLAGAPLLVLALWLLRAVTPAPLAPECPAAAGHPAARRAAFAPLLVALLIYAAVAALEVATGRAPELIADLKPAGTLALNRVPAAQAVTWRYELRNKGNETVGQSECTLSPAAGETRLQCSTQHRAFEVRLLSSYFSSPAVDAQQTTSWDAALRLRSTQGYRQTSTQARMDYEAYTLGTGLRVATTFPGDVQVHADAPGDVLFEGEWPWRLSGLSFRLGDSTHADMAWPSYWDEQTRESLPAARRVHVTVLGGAPVATPAGNFITWHVRIGDTSAWYDVRTPHTLVKYETSMLTYLLAP